MKRKRFRKAKFRVNRERLDCEVYSKYYQILNFIGEGSSHYVFLVRTSAIQPPWMPHKPFFSGGKMFEHSLKVLKYPKKKREVLSSRILKEDPSYKPTSASKRYKKILKKFSHPNIIDYFDIVNFRVNSRIVECLVEEYLRYPINMKQLAELPHNLIYSEAQQYIFHEVLQGVNYIHQQGFVHRDLNPSNILMSRLGRFYYTFGEPRDFDLYISQTIGDMHGFFVKITDFEIAKKIGSKKKIVSGPRLMQPMTDLPDVQREIYGLGVLLYYLIKKEFPYQLKENRDKKGFHEVDYSTKVDMSNIPNILREIISNAMFLDNKCFVKEYSNIGEIIQDYNEYFKGVEHFHDLYIEDARKNNRIVGELKV